MHVYYKFGLFLIFILSSSTFYTRAVPVTNKSNTGYDDYADDYDDYYDEQDSEPPASQASAMPANHIESTTYKSTTTPGPHKIEIATRSNHIVEPSCPRECFCQKDYTYIQCVNAKLTHVPDNLPITALVIDLRHNQITELTPQNFAKTTKVREINLNDNLLTDIDKQAFDGLKRLQRLYLANNRLTTIEADAFQGASDLTELDLSNNTIHLPSTGPFLNQSSLRELSCRNCSWSELYDDTFVNLASLTSLKLDKNDFNKKINAKSFTPLVNLIKLKLPELDEESIQELCNLLKSIDNISFKHFDVSCYELVLGTSFNKSLILATDPPFIAPPEQTNATFLKHAEMAAIGGENGLITNYSLPMPESDGKNLTTIVLKAGIAPETNTTAGPDQDGKTYQVPVSQETINIMLIAIMVVAVIGIIIGILCRKDVGGIKTKCCRTPKPPPKERPSPAEEIPLNKIE